MTTDSGALTGPRLVVILGPAAVGKMTVGQELAAQTGYALLYNHMVVDLVTAFVPFGSPPFHRLARSITHQLLETAAEERPGLVLTHGLLFNEHAKALLDEFAAPFEQRGGDAVFVELIAPLDIRLERNETENRRRHKKLDWATREHLTDMEGWGDWNSRGDFPYPDRHLVIDNTVMKAAAVARLIRERFAM
jgi:hypothetical protein